MKARLGKQQAGHWTGILDFGSELRNGALA
jgi:hypothetical protein